MDISKYFKYFHDLDDDLQNLIRLFYKQKYNQKYINEFMTTYNWSKKATLRIIELVNSI